MKRPRLRRQRRPVAERLPDRIVDLGGLELGRALRAARQKNAPVVEQCGGVIGALRLHRDRIQERVRGRVVDERDLPGIDGRAVQADAAGEQDGAVVEHGRGVRLTHPLHVRAAHEQPGRRLVVLGRLPIGGGGRLHRLAAGDEHPAVRQEARGVAAPIRRQRGAEDGAVRGRVGVGGAQEPAHPPEDHAQVDDVVGAAGQVEIADADGGDDVGRIAGAVRGPPGDGHRGVLHRGEPGQGALAVVAVPHGAFGLGEIRRLDVQLDVLQAERLIAEDGLVAGVVDHQVQLQRLAATDRADESQYDSQMTHVHHHTAWTVTELGARLFTRRTVPVTAPATTSAPPPPIAQNHHSSVMLF